jgi:hypothetical protein
MLQNTKQKIRTVNYSDLIPGKLYIMQHSLEGPFSEDYNTRFRGKFVRYEVGKMSGDPTGIQNLPENESIALFENVEIISKNKDEIPDDDLWVISTNPTNGRILAKNLTTYAANHNGEDDIYMDVTQQMIRDINNGDVGFVVDKWSFAESFKETEKAMKENILGHLANDGPNRNDTIEEQRRKIIRGKVFQPEGPGGIISNMAGIRFPETSGTKRKFGEMGGRKRSRRNRRGKTRKGKTRKGKARKSRRHYRK